MDVSVDKSETKPVVFEIGHLRFYGMGFLIDRL